MDTVFQINILGIKIKMNPRKNYLKKFFGYCYLGNNNNLFIEENGKLKKYNKKIKGLYIRINGDNNTIIINSKTLKTFYNSSININSNNTKIKIEETDRLNNLNISTCCGKNQELYWGKNSNCWGVTIFLNEENSSLIIGEDCMFSTGINIWATDGHAIIDKTTNKVINSLKNKTIIGNHVWVGAYSTILKNANIPNNSIIGASSVVTKSFSTPNILIAGNPGKIIKENVDWLRETAHIIMTSH